MIKFWFLFFISLSTQAQFLADTKAKESTTKALDYIYNFEFEKANQQLQLIQPKYEKHPVWYLISALKVYYEFMPVEKNTVQLAKYKSYLNLCINSARKLKSTYNKEASYYIMAAHGLIALQKNIGGENLEAALEAKKAYDVFSESKKYKAEIPEFYFSSGLYNFYRVQFPENHPSVKPIVMFFDGGDKEKGIQELEIATKNTVFSKYEATLYLINIYIKYRSDFKKAHKHALTLYAKAPNNPLVNIKALEAALYSEDVETIEPLLNALATKNSEIAKYAHQVLNAFYLHNFKGKEAEALNLYAKATKMETDKRFGKEYKAMAYLGMAEIFLKNKQNAKAKLMAKECLKLAEYQWVIKKANVILK